MSILTNKNFLSKIALARPGKDDQFSLANNRCGLSFNRIVYTNSGTKYLQLISASGIIQDHSNNRNPQ